MSTKKTQPPQVQQTAIGNDIIQVVGSNNIITRITNFFAGEKETTERRNRRIMLGHVENFWVKGILEKSLHGAALLELGIKEDPDALKYPWAIKREATKENLPAGMSMLKIFQEIGMGRSLLILGAPGSGKTTMLLELARQLIEHAREDVTEPIPVIFNLSSWTEKLTFADWLARELNNVYYVPRKAAPTWVTENKMLLLLDGLDEVRQESRNQCVDAINEFRKENGLTSIIVCSRIQDYAELKTRLSFEGAIEIQPLTLNQVDDYFKSFGKGLVGIRQVLEKDAVLREMAETPLFLSIMTLAYHDLQSKEILVSEELDTQRKQLFDIYIKRMFTRPERSKNESFKKQDVLHWLSWLAHKMIEHNQVPFFIERVQPGWLDQRKQLIHYRLIVSLISGLIFGLMLGLSLEMLANEIFRENSFWREIFFRGVCLLGGLMGGLITGLIFGLQDGLIKNIDNIDIVDTLTWNSNKVLRWQIYTLIGGLIGGLIYGLFVGLFAGLFAGLLVGLLLGMMNGLLLGMEAKQLKIITRPGERIFLATKNLLLTALYLGLFGGLITGLMGWLDSGLLGVMKFGLFGMLMFGLIFGLSFGGTTLSQHYTLRFVLSRNNLLPWKLIPFLDHSVELIFLRRVGGGYIFVHRLLMEHFAAMYPGDEK